MANVHCVYSVVRNSQAYSAVRVHAYSAVRVHAYSAVRVHAYSAVRGMLLLVESIKYRNNSMEIRARTVHKKLSQ